MQRMGTENKALFSTALGMWLDHGRSDTRFGESHGERGELFLESGLPFSLHVLAGSNEHEGTTVVAVAGSFDSLAHDPQGVLVRMHSACFFSEFGDNRTLQEWLNGHVTDPSDGMFIAAQSTPSTECDCKAQKEASQSMIASEGGIFFDLAEQEGRGAGLDVKREAYRLHYEQGLDTVQAYEALGKPFDTRQYGHCTRFLLDHGISKVRLLSNNPRKISALTEAGIEVESVPLVVGITRDNIDYLRIKRDKGGHRFPPDQGLRRKLNK